MHRAARMLILFSATSQFTLAMVGYFFVTVLGDVITSLGGTAFIDPNSFLYAIVGALVLLIFGMGGGPAPVMGAVVAIILTVMAGTVGGNMATVVPWVVLEAGCLAMWVIAERR